jgi:hypothetical protein
MHTYTFIYIYIYTHTYSYVCIYVYIRLYNIYIYIYTCIHIYTYTQVYPGNPCNMKRYILSTHTHTHTHTHTSGNPCKGEPVDKRGSAAMHITRAWLSAPCAYPPPELVACTHVQHAHDQYIIYIYTYANASL